MTIGPSLGGLGYTEVIRKGSNKETEAKISDQGTTTDNVIDLTKSSNLAEELKQTNAEFIKVNESTYLKLDLSNPDSVKKLLSDLKDNILSHDGQKVLAGFNYVSFSEDTGITIQSITQAKRLTASPKTDTPAKELSAETQSLYQTIAQERTAIAQTPEKDKAKLAEEKTQLNTDLLKLVSDPAMKEDIGKLLSLPKENLTKDQSKMLMELVDKYKKAGNLKELLLTFNTLSPEKNLKELVEKTPDSKIKQETLALIDSATKEILPNGINVVPLPVNKEAFTPADAIAQLNKLAEKHPEVKELLAKLDVTTKDVGKSLKLMGITKEDVALYLTTGQPNPKIEAAIQKAYKTGNWPAVITSLEITKLHRFALQDRIAESKDKISALFGELASAKTVEEQSKIKQEIFAFSAQLGELENMANADTHLLKTMPDAATRARTDVSKRAIGIFDSQLAKLKPDSPEYAKVKKLRDQEMVSLNNDAHALDLRIEKAESKGKKPTELKSMASNVHTTAASSDISMFGIESAQKQQGQGKVADPQTPPPASELLKTAEKHIEKVEKYNPNPTKDLSVQELRLSLHQAQRQDAKDRLQATGAVYDEKTKTFKYNIPSDYKAPTDTAKPSEKNYSAPQPLTSSADNPPSQVITDQQKEVEKDYHVAGIRTLDTIEKEKQILTPQLTTVAPTDPKEAKKQVEIVKKLSSLETTASDIKIEQANVIAQSKKADGEFKAADASYMAKQEQYSQKTKQKEGVVSEIKTLNDQLDQMKAELKDLQGSWVFDNPEKQKKLEKAIENGKAALTLLHKDYERLEKEEAKLMPYYTSSEPNNDSLEVAGERFRVASAKKEIGTAQADALSQAYVETKNTDPKATDLGILVDKAKQGIDAGQKVFTNAPEWMKGKPEFKAEQARVAFNDNMRQRTDLAETIDLAASEKAKAQYLQEHANSKEDKSVVEHKADKAGMQAGLKAKQDWDIGTVKEIDKAEATRVSLKDSPDLTKDQKQALAIDSVRAQITVGKGIANTIPEETLRLLGRGMETTEFEVSPDIPNAKGTHPLQTDLMESIGQTALESVGTSFRREMVFNGQKPNDKLSVGASQNLLDFTNMVADNLIKKNGGFEAAQKLKDTKQKWDTALKDIGKQADEHKEELKKEKALVLKAMDYQIYRTKEAADGHSVAAAVWQFRDVMETDDPNNKKAADFNYDKIDLELIDKAKRDITRKYDNQISQLSAFSTDFDTVLKGNRPLEYLSGLRLYSQGLDSNDKTAQDLAKQVTGNHKNAVNMDLILPQATNKWDPALRSWLNKGAVSEKGAGLREEAKSLLDSTGSLVNGGYKKEINDAKAMEGRYMGMSVTDVLGVDTTGWEIEDENFKWLNKVGSVLNKTDTVAMIAEIALTEVLTAGLGSAVASARVAMFLEKVAANYPRIEQAVALMKTLSTLAPSIISGEKNVSRAFSLLASVAKNEGLAVRTMSGMRRMEQVAEVGANASRLRTFVNGTVHMGQVVAVQNGMNLAAQHIFGEHSMAAKFVEFTGQFMFVNSSNKFSGIKDFSGRLAMNFATTYGQQYTASLVSFGIEKAMEASNGGAPLNAEQKLAAQKWGEHVSMAAGIVVPSLIGAMHTEKMPPEKVTEMSNFHTESLNTGLAKDSPEYKKINDAFGSYFKENSKESLKSLQEAVNLDKLPPQAKEAASKFIKEESAKLALKEMPKIDTTDPKAFAQHIEKNLNELNGKNGLPKYDAETINKIVSQQYISKTMEGISKVSVDFEKLNGSKGEKEALAETKNIVDMVKQRKEQLLEKFKDIPSFKPEEVKELVDTSMKMTLEELVKNKGVNKDALFSIAKAASEIDTPLVIKMSPEEGLPAQEFSVKLVKKQDGGEGLELSREGYEPIKLNKEDIANLSNDGSKLELKLKEGIKLQKIEPEKPATVAKKDTPEVKPEVKATDTPVIVVTPPEVKAQEPAKPATKAVDPELHGLFQGANMTDKKQAHDFIEAKKDQIATYLDKNIKAGNNDNIINFYKMMGGWENVKALDGKIPKETFDGIHKARDAKVKECWEQVVAEAHAKGLKEGDKVPYVLADGYVGTPPSEDPKSTYKRAWSDVDFSVKIKEPANLNPIDRHIAELELMQSMQKKLQEHFDGAPSNIVDSNAYATPLIMDIGKGKPVSDAVKALDKANQREMDFYQIRVGYGESSEGLEAYKLFKEETLQLAKTKGDEFVKSIEQNFSKAEEKFSKMETDVKAKMEEFKKTNPDKSDKVLEEMAVTSLRYEKENDLMKFMKDNKDILINDNTSNGQQARAEFNQKAREMRALWPEAYIGDQAARWGSSGKEMAATFKSMTNAEKMQARISQDQFKLHWLAEVREEKDVSTRLLKAAKYELRDLDFKKAQFEAITGSSKDVSHIEKNPAFNPNDKVSRDTVKAYTSEDFPDHAAFQEIKEFAKNPAEAEKIWEKHFGKPPDIKASAARALDEYLALMESVTTVNLFNHLTKPELQD